MPTRNQKYPGDIQFSEIIQNQLIGKIVPSDDKQSLNAAVEAHLLEQVKNMAPAEITGISSWHTSTDKFSHSILFSATRPSGGVHIFVGEFSEQGLPAAMGIVSIAEVFYGMTEKGFGLSEMIEELNKKLCFMLPETLFCSACLIELDQEGKMLTVWNGGLPELIIIDAQRQVTHRVPANDRSLGVTQLSEEATRHTVFIDVDAGDKMYVYTQGLSKMLSPQESGIEQLLVSGSNFSELADYVNRLSARKQITEDILLVELDIEQARSAEMANVVHQHRITIPPADWQVEFEFSAQILKHLDLVPLLNQVVMTIQAPQDHQQRIYTVLAEMCSNALEHGILKLDSGMKQHAHGFAEYYTLRSQRLAALEEATIKVSLRHKRIMQGGALTICVEDSGEGFDYQKQAREQKENSGYCGRGEAILRQLCTDYFFSGKGNIATAVYHWE